MIQNGGIEMIPVVYPLFSFSNESFNGFVFRMNSPVSAHNADHEAPGEENTERQQDGPREANHPWVFGFNELWTLSRQQVLSPVLVSEWYYLHHIAFDMAEVWSSINWFSSLLCRGVKMPQWLRPLRLTTVHVGSIPTFVMPSLLMPAFKLSQAFSWPVCYRWSKH